METLKHNESSHEIILSPEDVADAIRRFISEEMPEYDTHLWSMVPKYQLGQTAFAATREAAPRKEKTRALRTRYTVTVIETGVRNKWNGVKYTSVTNIENLKRFAKEKRLIGEVVTVKDATDPEQVREAHDRMTSGALGGRGIDIANASHVIERVTGPGKTGRVRITFRILDTPGGRALAHGMASAVFVPRDHVTAGVTTFDAYVNSDGRRIMDMLENV